MGAVVAGLLGTGVVRGAAVWSRPLATLTGSAFGAERVGAAAGASTWATYELAATDGPVVLDGFSVAGSGIDVELAVAPAEGCQRGLTTDPPRGCELRPLDGATVEPGAPVVLVARYSLVRDRPARVDDLVVAYDDGRHRHELALAVTMCLSPDVPDRSSPSSTTVPLDAAACLG